MRSRIFVDSVQASAAGKVIITGEHSVVYGMPALAASINLRSTAIVNRIATQEIIIKAPDIRSKRGYTFAEIDNILTTPQDGKLDGMALVAYKTLQKFAANPQFGVEIALSSTIPVSAGLGSSAAIAAATAAAVYGLFDSNIEPAVISELAFESEKVVHGNPSGIDNLISSYGGFLRYEGGKHTLLDVQSTIPLIIANTKIPRNTKDLVAKVGIYKEEFPEIMQAVLDSMGILTNRFEQLLMTKDLQTLGTLMNINQGLLDAIGVNHQRLSEYIWTARDAGALGAKLTGAGGGGCMIAIAKDAESSAQIVGRLKEHHAEVIATSISPKGVTLE